METYDWKSTIMCTWTLEKGPCALPLSPSLLALTKHVWKEQSQQQATVPSLSFLENALGKKDGLMNIKLGIVFTIANNGI